MIFIIQASDLFQIPIGNKRSKWCVCMRFNILIPPYQKSKYSTVLFFNEITGIYLVIFNFTSLLRAVLKVNKELSFLYTYYYIKVSPIETRDVVIR